jgi:amino acid transporter
VTAALASGLAYSVVISAARQPAARKVRTADQLTSSAPTMTAFFVDLSIGTFSPSWAASYSPTRQFIEFGVIVAVMVALNVIRTRLLALFNSISVWWQLIGVAVIIGVLAFVPAHHESVSWVFTHRINNSGWFGGKVGGVPFWFVVFPFGFLLTQYTITGFDASAHMSEETNRASKGAAQGLYRSILCAAIAGWLLELAFLFAVQPGNVAAHVGSHTAITGEACISSQGGFVASLLNQALSSNLSGFVLIISAVGQLFGMLAVITSTSRMMYAFSRDGAVPLSERWARLNKNKTPVNAVLAMGVIAVIITLLALYQPKVNGAYTNVVFNALTSITVIGLFLAFIIPVYQRWRMGPRFEPGPWNLGSWRAGDRRRIRRHGPRPVRGARPGRPAGNRWCSWPGWATTTRHGTRSWAT